VTILCRPAESGNVGAACRAMKTMGLSKLRIVAPEKPLDDGVVRMFAVHAADLWESALFFDDLPSAIADCTLVAGTTRRTGKKRKDFPLTPEEFVDYIGEKEGQVGLVYGNERTGLEAEELALCDLAVGIPSSDAFPSLNLSHAVQICSYALFRGLSGPRAPHGGHYVPIHRARLDETVSVICDTLQGMGFYKIAGRGEQEVFFREILTRAGMTIGETRYLETIFRKMARLASPSNERVDEEREGTHN